MCALAAGCRMHDCLENNNLSVACPDHFHVDTQIAKGTVARQLPWAASQGGPKRPKLAPRKSTKKAGEAKCPTAKPPVTVQARKSTVCHPGGQAAVHQTGGDEYVPEEEGEGAESEEWEGSERGFGQSPRKRSKNSPQPLKRALELSPSYGELPGTTLDNQSPGGGSKRGKKRGNRELRSILADVPKQKKLPSIEAQLEKQRDMLLKRQDVGKSKRAAIIENASLDAESVALVAELAPSLQKVMKRLAEEGANGHLGWRDRKGGVPTAERNGHLERKAEGAGPLLGPATGNPVRGSPGRLGQSGRVLGAAEIARGLLGVPKVEARSSPLPVPSTPLESTENAEPGENSDGETELVEPIGPTYDDVSSEAQTDEVTEVDEKELAEVQGGVEDLEMVNRLEEGAEMEACANELQFVCAACGVAGGRSEMERHPALPAVLCEECLESFNSANFSDRVSRAAGLKRRALFSDEASLVAFRSLMIFRCARRIEGVLVPEKTFALLTKTDGCFHSPRCITLEDVRPELQTADLKRPWFGSFSREPSLGTPVLRRADILEAL